MRRIWVHHPLTGLNWPCSRSQLKQLFLQTRHWSMGRSWLWDSKLPAFSGGEALRHLAPWTGLTCARLHTAPVAWQGACFGEHCSCLVTAVPWHVLRYLENCQLQWMHNKIIQFIEIAWKINVRIAFLFVLGFPHLWEYLFVLKMEKYIQHKEKKKKKKNSKAAN